MFCTPYWTNGYTCMPAQVSPSRGSERRTPGGDSERLAWLPRGLVFFVAALYYAAEYTFAPMTWPSTHIPGPWRGTVVRAATVTIVLRQEGVVFAFAQAPRGDLAVFILQEDPGYCEATNLLPPRLSLRIHL
jgi:hypothetical protein